VKRIPAWLSYTLLRLVFFIVPFVVLWLFGFEPWMAAILAAAIALSLSIIFLSKFRNATSTSIASVRDNKTPKRSIDEEVEDAL
jgi:L-lactate permease